MTAWPVPLAGDCTTTRTSAQRASRDRLRRLRAGDHDHVVGARLARGLDDPGQHRQPAQLVQDLRQRRAHPGAQPAGHDDRGDGSHRRGARGSARRSLPGIPRRDDSRCAARVRPALGEPDEESWGARIRTWDHGTKARCLTAWPRPTGRQSRTCRARLRNGCDRRAGASAARATRRRRSGSRRRWSPESPRPPARADPVRTR